MQKPVAWEIPKEEFTVLNLEKNGLTNGHIQTSHKPKRQKYKVFSKMIEYLTTYSGILPTWTSKRQWYSYIIPVIIVIIVLVLYGYISYSFFYCIFRLRYTSIKTIEIAPWSLHFFTPICAHLILFWKQSDIQNFINKWNIKLSEYFLCMEYRDRTSYYIICGIYLIFFIVSTTITLVFLESRAMDHVSFTKLPILPTDSGFTIAIFLHLFESAYTWILLFICDVGIGYIYCEIALNIQGAKTYFSHNFYQLTTCPKCTKLDRVPAPTEIIMKLNDSNSTVVSLWKTTEFLRDITESCNSIFGLLIVINHLNNIAIICVSLFGVIKLWRNLGLAVVYHLLQAVIVISRVFIFYKLASPTEEEVKKLQMILSFRAASNWESTTSSDKKAIQTLLQYLSTSPLRCSVMDIYKVNSALLTLFYAIVLTLLIAFLHT
ncbi:uncharacterized protein LOC136031686 [Artemia franciscana]|uniref:uncharacterized protein LOC136031686 n=1 Tax=Artemia franciscana TaxID=6661 RepID=UPI0032D9F800